MGGHKNGLMESRASLLARVGAAMSVLPPLVSPDAHSPPTVAKIGASPLDFWKTDTHWHNKLRLHFAGPASHTYAPGSPRHSSALAQTLTPGVIPARRPGDCPSADKRPPDY